MYVSCIFFFSLTSFKYLCLLTLLFVTGCKKGNVGLSQVVGVTDIMDEEPTGLYDGFYVKTK